MQNNKYQNVNVVNEIYVTALCMGLKDIIV